MQTNTVDDLLQFKDYSNTANMSSPPAQINVNSPTNSATSTSSATNGRTRGDPLAELIYDMSNSAQVLSGDSSKMNAGAGAGSNDDETNPNANNVSFLTLEYYQRFFNVDAYMVLERIANSMIPKRAPSNYLRNSLGENPDLYGPFWIAVTLIFSIAITGNIANYVLHPKAEGHWHYNFHLVSYAATCIFVYINFMPAILWAVLKYSLKPVEEGLEIENANYTPSLLSLMCIYGYSLAIYIPVSILWVIPINIFQWLLVGTAAFLTGIALITILQPALRNSKYSYILIICILSAHFVLAAGFMLYFFHT